ncbi:hypothetical protein MTBBW1_460005 [Desulfamplus magnetovallimortis]|uniref:Uncharacterized protein n=1 Tax=Desulfamplus magnetovallimortis TaxID=1246637 RepID=A0A1W1HH94_9BACT|nr:hypothetical protein MTBBW1_460005 [Desulfamplus magnetovallimortis]
MQNDLCKLSWPNKISATPDNENKMCFHGKRAWLLARHPRT